MAGHVIRRKLQQAMADDDNPQLSGIGAERAWKLAFARQARDAFGLQCDFAAVSLRCLTLTELLEILPSHALLLVLEGPEEGLGLCVLSAPVMSGLAEVMTMGHLAHRAPPPRRPTRIDAAILAPFIDDTLEQLEQLLIEDDALTWAGGFRFSSFVEEPRPLGLILEDVGYHLLQASLVMGGGAREGDLFLLLPAAGRGARPRRRRENLDTAGFSQALGEQLQDCAVELDAVLCRVKLPLSELGAWKVGDWLNLPLADLGAVDLCAANARRLVTAQLGQHRGMRALRMADQPKEDGRETSSLAAFQAEFSGMTDLAETGQDLEDEAGYAADDEEAEAEDISFASAAGL